MKFCAGILDFKNSRIDIRNSRIPNIYALKCKLREREIKIVRAFCSFLPIL